MSVLLLCDSSYKSIESYDLTVHWDSFEEGRNSFSIPKIIENNSVIFKNRYLTWLSELGLSKVGNDSVVKHLAIRKEFSFWWMSLLVEKSQWKSPSIYKVFQLMAFDFLLQQHKVSKVDIMVADKTVQESIRQYCIESGIRFKIFTISCTEKISLARRLYNLIPHIFQGALFFINSLIYFCMLNKCKKPNNSYFSNNNITFISYLFNFDESLSNNSKFYSSYWTSLHDLLAIDKINVNWLHLFVESDALPTLKKALKLVNKFNAKHANTHFHILLENGFEWAVVKGIAKDYLKLILIGFELRKIKNNFKLKGSNISFWHIMKSDWRSSIFGKTAVSNCIFLNLFENEFKKIPKQKKGFYLMENQAWERSLVYVWKKFGHGQIIGVPHTVISNWDLRHFFSHVEYTNKLYKLPMPDKVALNGRMAIRAYIDGGFPRNKIVRVEALRYLYLDRANKNSDNKSHLKFLRLLVLTDYNADTTREQLSILEVAVGQLYNDIEIFIKPHPARHIEVQDWPKLKMNIVDGPLHELIDQCDVAFTSNTTASALDVYLSGKRILVMSNPRSFNISPLRGCEGVEFVKTAEELAVCLSERTNGSDINIDQNFFFLNDKLPKWKALLNI